MEIDALGLQNVSAPPSIMDVSRTLCRSHKLCFCCLKPIVPGLHLGSINCLNLPVSLDKQKAFVDKAKATAATPVAAVQSADLATLSYQDLYADPSLDSHLTPFESEDVHHGLDEMYKDYKEAKAATVPVSTV
ncbi:hypothetical protein PCASD_13001 [Puccinia coronata f. sp. avenae]|uniref:Uncharacterized protein n=1 Tax=Puccinia coronata f. sp. avenae TaxID=200324 RepID=A0A2N5UBH6_9BASI|nr:hypothetical protein PCASD_13001 [Puccinia coronata f. sp. avenae]